MEDADESNNQQSQKTWEDQVAQFRQQARSRLREQRNDNRLQIKNRRKRYLELHPDYFEDPVHAVAQRRLHSRLIRPHLTRAQREAHSRALSDGLNEEKYVEEWDDAVANEARGKPSPHALFAFERHERSFYLPKDEAYAVWNDELTQRFLRGEDSAFDYSKVDENDAYIDPEEERDREEGLHGIIDDESEGWEVMPPRENGDREYDY